MAEKLPVGFGRVVRAIKEVARTIHDEAELRKKAQAENEETTVANSCTSW